MPKVPTYDNFQAAPNALPQARLDAAFVPDIAGRQAQQMGQALQQSSADVGRIAIDMQQQANQLRVDEALNSAKEEALRLTFDKDSGFTALKGINAIERPDGKALADEYGGALQQRIEQISGGLGNDFQRQAFAQHASSILTSFRGQATQHEAQEYKNHALSVADGIQATALRDIELNYNNPEAIDKAVFRIKAETYRQAQLLGKSAEWQEAQAVKLTSSAHRVALMTALENNDPAYAESYLKKYSSQMDGDDILAVQGHITKEMAARTGLTVSDEKLRAVQPRIQTSEIERAFNVAINAESGGQQFGKDGQPMTSPKGAIGIAQLMPGTAKEWAEKSGLGWDESRYKTDANYNKAVGMWGFQSLLQQNAGDIEKAYAAYNAGPGALQEAIKKADRSVALNKQDPAVQAHAWLDFMPKETRDYVTKNMAAYSAGQGQNTRPTFSEIDDALRADPRLASNPAAYRVAREDAERRFNEQTKAIKQREEDAVANAMRAVVQNGGKYFDLPVSVRSAIPPKEIDSVIGFAQKISKGDDTTSLWLYNDLSSHPQKLASYTDAQFYALRRELSDADFKHFSNERAKLTGAVPGGNGPGDLNTTAIKATLDARLRVLGNDPTPKDGGDDAARIGAMRQFVDQYFIAAQKETGRKFNDSEVTQHIDALFAQNATFRGWLSTSSGPMLGMTAGDIPSDAKAGLKAAFKQQGVDDPTDAQLLNAYWSMKVAKR